MSLVGSMFAGVSGLRANAQAMALIGDNVANINTTAFKTSKAAFGDILTRTLSGASNLQIGRGTVILGSVQNFEQGAFETTGTSTDMAIDGTGFFVVKKNSGTFYTRAGQFRLNNAGLLADPNGSVLQGFAVSSGGTANSVSDIDLAGVQSSPQATTQFTLGANLDPSASAGTTFTSPISTFDSLGNNVLMNITFSKIAGANSWAYGISSSRGTVTSASGTVSFNTSGQLIPPATDPVITIDLSGANPPAAALSVTWDLLDGSGATNGKLTGFAAPSTNNSVVQNGFSTGTLIGLNVDKNGFISGLFDNGQTQNLFQVALANFLSLEGLDKVGQNLFSQSNASGQPIVGTPNSGALGSILGSSLELSNVDLASEFVNLIQTQQAFQASTRIITTANDLLTEAVNLKR